MKRRQILPSAVGAVGMSTLSRAQAPRPPGKIGFLQTLPITANSATIPMLRAAWQRLGFVEGETVLLRSGAGDPRRVPQLVAELIALKVGVLIVVGGEASGWRLKLRRRHRSLPSTWRSTRFAPGSPRAAPSRVAMSRACPWTSRRWPANGSVCCARRHRPSSAWLCCGTPVRAAINWRVGTLRPGPRGFRQRSSNTASPRTSMMHCAVS